MVLNRKLVSSDMRNEFVFVRYKYEGQGFI